MSSNEIAISVQGVNKCYKIYDRPQDRLKQGLFRNKRQYYREFWALHGVSFDVKKGETVGIIGRNGSGKSTLLQIIAGTLSPTEGSVDVLGRVAALLELGSGFNPEFTGRENVFLNGAILGLTPSEIEDLYDDILAFADIGEHIDQPIKTYSSGMVVRLAFAVQAMVPKEVLIVDEALAVGDELFQRKCFAKIEEFKQQGGTILFVSHDGASVVQLCDRAVLMDSGEVLMIGPSKRTVNLYQKLMYCPADKKPEMREEIKAHTQQLLQEAVNAAEDQTKVKAEQAEKMESVQEHTSIQPMFDPNLVPSETLHYESRGAHIFDPEITTLSGNQVNLLIAGHPYVYRYSVRFERPCSYLRFGMLIKTPNGLAIGGGVSAQQGQGIRDVAPGDVVRVEFTFTPRLNTGTFFMNAGVLGTTEEGEVYLDRCIDLAAFKILHDQESLGTGMVDFDIIPAVAVVR